MSDTSEIKIKAVHGMEPRRDGEYPFSYMVGGICGYPKFMVTEIKRRDENFGTYGIAWFDVFESGKMLVSVNASAVSEVHYV